MSEIHSGASSWLTLAAAPTFAMDGADDGVTVGASGRGFAVRDGNLVTGQQNFSGPETARAVCEARAAVEQRLDRIYPECTSQNARKRI